MKKINALSFLTQEERDATEKLLQSVSISDNRNTVTKFLTNFEQVILKKIIMYNYSDMSIDFFGGTVDAERKKAKIIANEYYDIDYEITCLRANYNNKFDKIQHRDVLGAVHNMGINFNRIGDIVVLEREIYIFVDYEIADYIMMQLTKIGRINLQFEKIDLVEVNIEKEYEEFDIVSSSFRLDSLVAKITNKSRSKVKEFLEQEFIKLNHSVIKNGEKNCVNGDVISIRKYGRFILKEYTQNKKSLKYRIKVLKLVQNNWHYKGHFKNKPTIVSSVGETYYLGYGQDCLIRFYDKKIETILKHKLRALEYLKDNYPEVTRIELQMRNKYAQVFIEDILKYQNEENVIQETIRSWLCKKITFLATPSGDEKKSRIPIAPFWREFSEVKLEVKATFERHNITLEDSMMHVVRNNKSLSAMYFIKKYYEETKKEPSNPLFKKMMDSSFNFLEKENYYVTKKMYYRLIAYAQIEKDEELLELIKTKLIVV